MVPTKAPAICLATLVGLAAFAHPGELLACSGPPFIAEDPEGRFETHDVVARGEVVRVSSIYRWQDERWQLRPVIGLWWLNAGGAGMVVEIEVEEAWKGVERRRIVVEDDGVDTCCGMRHVSEGEEVLVYAREYEGELYIDGRCAPIISIAEAEADLDWLGPGQRELRRGRPSWRELLGLTALLASLGLLAYSGLQRRRGATTARRPEEAREQ